MNGLIFAYDKTLKPLKQIKNIKDKHWLHLNYGDDSTKDWIKNYSNLPQEVINNLLENRDISSFDEYDEGLFLSIKAINFYNQLNDQELITLKIWLDKDRLITFRNDKIKSIDDIKNRLENSKIKFDLNLIFIEILKRLNNNIYQNSYALYDEIENLEDELLDGNHKNLRNLISSFRKKIITFKRYILPQRDIVFNLYKLPTQFFSNDDKDEIKDIYEWLDRAISDLNSTKDRIIITQEELNGKLSEEMNKTMYLLSIVSAIFLPLGFITGLLGINVGGMPGINSNNAFFIVCVIIIIISIIEIIILKIKKIL